MPFFEQYEPDEIVNLIREHLLHCADAIKYLSEGSSTYKSNSIKVIRANLLVERRFAVPDREMVNGKMIVHPRYLTIAADLLR